MNTTLEPPLKTPATTDNPGDLGKQTGVESALSNWVGPYVTDMLGKGKAVSELPYEAYTGQLTAGQSAPKHRHFRVLLT